MQDGKFYKIIRDGRSCNGGNMAWSLPRGKRPGKWHKVDLPLSPCRHGIHLAAQPYAKWFQSLNCSVYEAEPGKTIIKHGDDKIVTEKARLIREVPSPKWLIAARRFVASIPQTKWFQADGEPLPEWLVFPTRAAAGAAAGAAAWAAARAAAWDAARDAARAAAGAARAEIVSDVLDTVHLAHLRAHWQVWQKGYGCYGDIKGVLYVYERMA